MTRLLNERKKSWKSEERGKKQGHIIERKNFISEINSNQQ